jgi:mevalonate kinase
MSEGTQTYKSHGKFLITAEYLILKGAKGLALPLNRGQVLYIQPNNTEHIHWKSKVLGATWFEVNMKVNDLQIIHTTDHEIAQSLQKLLQQARNLNPGLLAYGVDAIIEADFNLSWGLGSSSTLVNNIAEWAKVDPYILLEKTFGGSGYDIACAGATGPITYQLSGNSRMIENANFHPSFSARLFFVYLGKKMNSRTGMSYFKEKAIYGEKEIERINRITEKIITSNDLKNFEDLLTQHETLLSTILKIPTIQSSQFPDYPFVIKSMGAWGGDFVLVTGENLNQVQSYFNAKGLDVVIPYHDIVLS